MTKTLIGTLCLIALVALLRCSPHNSTPPNNATCKTCGTAPVAYLADTDGMFYFMPTAFTPNGDGINDVFSVIYNKLDTDSSVITIWNTAGTEVFTGKLTKRWEGRDLAGKVCAAGQYPVYLDLRTSAGQKVQLCACVHLLKYSGSCIATDGITYYFPDQLDFASGFVYATQEQLCP